MIEEKDKISVIIPVYNIADFLPKCLDSIIHNTYNNLEIICINDGSTDSSLEVLNHFAEKDSRIVVVNKKNEGVSAARNKGIETATGDFVTFIDGDDMVHSRYFEILKNTMEKGKADITVCEYSVFDDLSQINSYLENHYEHYSYNAVDNEFPINYLKSVVNVLYRSEVIKHCRFPVGIKIAEDTYFNVFLYIYMLDRGKKLKVVSVNEKLYYYFRREDSAVHSIPIYTGRTDIIKLYINMYDSLTISKCKSLILDYSIKNLLAIRYLAMYSKEYNQIKKDAQPLFRKLFSLLRTNREIGILKKTVYYMFFKFPMIYRLYRIITDKSMLDYERKQRLENKNV